MSWMWECSRNYDYMVWEKGDQAAEDKTMSTVTKCGALGAAMIDIIFIIILILMLKSSSNADSASTVSGAASEGADSGVSTVTVIVLGALIVIVPLVSIIGARWHMRARAANYHASGLTRAQFLATDAQFAQAAATRAAGADVAGAIIGASVASR